MIIVARHDLQSLKLEQIVGGTDAHAIEEVDDVVGNGEIRSQGPRSTITGKL